MSKIRKEVSQIVSKKLGEIKYESMHLMNDPMFLPEMIF